MYLLRVFAFLRPLLSGLCYYAVRAKHFLYLFQRCGDLVHRVGGHEREPDQRIVGSHGGRDHGVHENAFLEKVARLNYVLRRI